MAFFKYILLLTVVTSVDGRPITSGKTTIAPSSEPSVTPQNSVTTGKDVESNKLLNRILSLRDSEERNQLIRDLFTDAEERHRDLLKNAEERHRDLLKNAEERHRDLLKDAEKKLTQKDEIIKNETGTIKQITIEKEQVAADAELAEFLLFTREGLVTFEEQASRGMISDTNAFAIELSKITKLPKAELTGRKHFKKWMHILVFGNAEKFNSIEKLRAALNHDYKRYIWFASQIQNVFDVLCGDVHGKSPLEIRHMKKTKFREYVRFFTSEIRTALVIFLENVY